MAKGQLIVALDFSSIAEDEFHDWFDTEHMPERERVPGFCPAGAGLACRTRRKRSTSSISIVSPS